MKSLASFGIKSALCLLLILSTSAYPQVGINIAQYKLSIRGNISPGSIPDGIAFDNILRHLDRHKDTFSPEDFEILAVEKSRKFEFRKSFYESYKLSKLNFCNKFIWSTRTIDPNEFGQAFTDLDEAFNGLYNARLDNTLERLSTDAVEIILLDLIPDIKNRTSRSTTNMPLLAREHPSYVRSRFIPTCNVLLDTWDIPYESRPTYAISRPGLFVEMF